MNSYQAKKIPLPDLLSRLGHQPVRSLKGQRELWYISPFRQEKEPSFHTSYLGGKWIWNDFGDSGGTVIDFVMRYQGYSKVKDALAYLDKLYSHSVPSPHFSFQQQEFKRRAQEDESRALEFISASKVQNPAIINYLEQKRCIPLSLIKKYLLEVRYLNKGKGKEYFAFGMKNESGGYEIRSASDAYPFKSALIKKDITLIKGRGDGKEVSVFEGMLDYLSLLVFQGQNQLAEDSIVLNSLSTCEQTIALIQERNFQIINLYLDNNQAGKDCLFKFKEIMGAKVKDRSLFFAQFTDLNEMLIASFN